MIKLIWLILFCCFNAQSVTIEDAVIIALKNEGYSALIEEQTDVAFGQYLASYSGVLPDVNYSITHALSKSSAIGPGLIGLLGSASSPSGFVGAVNGYRSFSVSYDLSFYYTLPQIYSKAIAYKSSLYGRNIQMTEFVSNVIQAYVNLATAREKKKITEVLKQVNAKKTEQAIIMRNHKLLSEADLENIEAMNLEIEANEIQAEADLAKAELDYNKLVGENLDVADLKKDYTTLPIANIEEFISLVESKNPDLKRSQMNADLAKIQNTLSWVALMPKISFIYSNLDYGPGFSGNSLLQFQYTGIVLDIPIFDKGKTWTNIYLAHKNQKINYITNQLQKKEIGATAQQSWIAYASVTKILEAKKKYISASEKKLKKAKQNLKSKIISQIDFSMEEYSLLQKKIDFLDIQKRQILAYYQILSLAGINPLIKYK